MGFSGTVCTLYAYTCTHVCTCCGGQSWCWVHSSTALHPVFWGRIFYWTWSSPCLLKCPATLGGISLCLTSTKIIGTGHSFYMGAGIWTQTLMLVQQALYPLYRYLFSPFMIPEKSFLHILNWPAQLTLRNAGKTISILCWWNQTSQKQGSSGPRLRSGSAKPFQCSLTCRIPAYDHSIQKKKKTQNQTTTTNSNNWTSCFYLHGMET